MRPLVVNFLSDENEQDKKILVLHYKKMCNAENRFMKIIGILFVDSIHKEYYIIIVLYFCYFS